MVAIVDAISELNLRHFEERPADELVRELKPVATGFVDQATAAIDAVTTRSSGEPASSPAEPDASGDRREVPLDDRFEIALDSLVDQAAPALQAIDDIAFVARMELRQRRARLAALGPDHSRIDILSECERALRGVRKSLSALDQAIADAWRVPRRLDYRPELETSLRVRRCYAKFRNQILGDGEPGREDVYSRLRAAGTAIAMLVGRDIYPELRIRDRLQIRELQARILTWLEDGTSDLHAGLNVFQDLAAFVGMLREINNRQELMTHDAEAVAELCEALEREREDAPIPDTLYPRLESLRGLDDEIDGLLDRPSPHDRSAWRPPLERLRFHLAAAAFPR